MKLIVKADKLNKRKIIPATLSDRNSIAGVVKKGFTFEGTVAPNPPGTSGKWYKDRDGYFYWGDAVTLLENAAAAIVETSIPAKTDWWYNSLKVEELWKRSKGENVKVAILDSGLNSDLEEFKDNRNISFYNAFTDSQQRNDCLDDPSCHGTECASILCSQGKLIYGVAPQVSLLIVKIADDSGQRKTNAIVKGLSKAIASQCDIISMSFSISEQDEHFKRIHEFILEAYDRDIVIVASAGDSGGVNFPVDEYPASFPECLSIGAITKTGVRSSVSTKSNFLDFVAPGDELFSLTNSGQTLSGTSYSTPLVAGLIALIKSMLKAKNIPVTNIKLFDVLKRTADKNFPNYNTLEYGWGMINPAAALQLLLPA